MKKNPLKIALLLLLMSTFSISCSKGKCNITLLSFNNHLSYKIKVVVRDLALTATIDPGSSKTVHVKPNKSYEYTVEEYSTAKIVARDNVSVDQCVSKGVNIN